ncbi:septum formation protein Maf [Candidatus Gottesmanbacteria bacterium]|nr:septum formation protein Maf [Candidatus Gottesmanbacteria bacterium]
MKIILASKSPARKKLLLELGLKFEVVPSEVDEEKFQDKKPSVRVKKIALAKAKAVLEKASKEAVIIAADTMIYYQGKFIGKPKSLAEAERMLSLLSGSTHFLYTGTCVIKGNRTILDYDKSEVTFRKLMPNEIADCVKDPEVLNHAGAYTIEKTTFGSGFIKKIKGSYSNVLGLPVEKLNKILKIKN